MSRRNQALLLILSFMFLTTIAKGAEKHPSKFSQQHSDAIISYVLFNYDNLIADYYEHKADYSAPLASLLNKTSGYPISDCLELINSANLNIEPNPVQYMLKLNRALKTKTGYFFVDE